MTATPPPDDKHVDALKALAEGPQADPDAPETDDIANAAPALEGDELYAMIGQEADEPAAETFAPALPVARANRQNQAIQARQAQGHQLKKLMIPLLLVTAGLLIALGSVGAYFAFTPDAGAADGDVGMDGGPMMKLGVILAFPLAAILLVGALLFARDTHKTDGGR